VTVSQSTTTGAAPSGVQGVPDTSGPVAGKDGKPLPPNNGDDYKDMCAAHPELNICHNSSVQGACDAAGAAAISCTGDAIQCATLQQAAAIACKQKQDDADLKASALFSKGTAVSSGADPDAATLPDPSKAATVAVPTSLDTSGFLSGGSPFDDVSFTVQGKSITVPLNKWSSYLLAFRYVMMVIASLVSFRMLSGAVLRD
jgi:hypothetical protein